MADPRMSRPACCSLTLSRGAASGGFTLMELLVAATLFAGIVAVSVASLHGGSRSARVVETRSEQLQSVRAALRLLEQDLRHARVLHPRAPFHGALRAIGGRPAASLDLATHRWQPRTPGEGDYCEVSYFLAEHPQTGVVGLWRRQDPGPDDDPLAGGFVEELASGVSGFDLEYSDGITWTESWGELDTSAFEAGAGATSTDPPASSLLAPSGPLLPVAVRVRLSLGGAPPGREAHEGDSARTGGTPPEATRRDSLGSTPGDTDSTGDGAHDPASATSLARDSSTATDGARRGTEPASGSAPDVFVETVIFLPLAARTDPTLAADRGLVGEVATGSSGTSAPAQAGEQP